MPQSPATQTQAPSNAVQTTAPAGVAAPARASDAVPSPISAEQAAFLRVRRDALSNQLSNVENRRDEVAEKLRDEDTQAYERPGLQDRLRVLDERLVQIEQEIAANSEQLANAPPRRETNAVAEVPARGAARDGRKFNEVGMAFTFLLLAPFAWHLSRRWFGPSRGATRGELAELASMRDRMDKLDGAVDAVALEVERIGEGQRFLTQAMTDNLPRRQAAAGVQSPEREPVAVRAMEPLDRR